MRRKREEDEEENGKGQSECCAKNDSRSGPRRDQARPSEPRSDSVKEEDDEEGIGQSERDRKGGRGTATRDINDLSSPSRFAATEAVPGGTRLAPANLAQTP
ncbi:hypothetical protein D9C73_000105 [Collichthys lucidus]|uniref:Uncharacterized protein n=1 Tax=Collichthys lucidus TaxID=240159 RepID=A0A4U5TX90_COLLU|nr:hypothetical protein D9C73_000105 [Collichthys lucidus]